MVCKFSKVCKLFTAKSRTCRVKDAENGYCGKYRELMKKEELKRRRESS